jgi:hypothetical protein
VHRLVAGSHPLIDRLRADTRAALPELKAEDVWLFGYQAKHAYDALVLPAVVNYLRDYSAAELAAMARSFAFANCEIDEPRLDLFARHAR